MKEDIKMEYKEIIGLLEFTNGKYRNIDILKDIIFILTLLMNDTFDRTATNKYKKIMEKYEKSELNTLKIIMHKIVSLYEENEISDILGEIFEAVGGNYRLLDNRYFTPMSIARVMASSLNLEEIRNREFTTIYDAECSNGVMLLGVAKYLKEKGIDYKEKMYAYAEETDIICAYITYIQLTLYDIPGRIVLLNKNRDKVCIELYTIRHYLKNWNEKLKDNREKMRLDLKNNKKR